MIKQKVLVTGANGYLGNGIVKKLLDDGMTVLATDICDNYIDKRANIIPADLFSLSNPFEYFQAPDILLHLAWKDGFKHDSINHILNLPMHYDFIKKMVEGGIKHLAIMGSVHEVGFYEGSVDEKTPTNPLSLYGISKNALRQMAEVLVAGKEICFQWIRGYYIVGNKENGCSVFSKIVQAEKAGKKEFPFVKGINQFDFLDYDDFCMKTAAIIEQTEVQGIINCCSGHPEKLGDRVNRFIKDNGYNIKLNYGAFQERPYDSKAVWGDSKKIDSIMHRKNQLAS